MSAPQPQPQVDTSHLWQVLAQDIRRFLSRRVEPSAVDDLLQEIFLRVHRRKHELRASERVTGWVFRIAQNVVIDHLRKRRPTVEVEERDGLEIGLVDDEEDGVTPEQQLGTWLRGALETLPEPYRDALRLTEIGGLTQKEAAERLGLSYSGLKSRVQRGRAMLRKALLRCCEVELDATGRVLTYAPRGRCDSGSCSGSSCVE